MQPIGPAAVVARLYPALAAGDRDTLDALLTEDFVGESTPGLPLGLGGRYDGSRAMRREFWGALGRAFDVVAEPHRFDVIDDDRAAEQRVVVSGTYRGSARDTGVKFEAPFVHTVTVRGEQLSGLVQLTDSAAWQAALEQPSANDAVLLSVDAGIARLTLNRAAQANAIDEAVARGIRDAADRVARNPSVRVLLITGDGSRFSAGGDLKAFVDRSPDQLGDLLETMITDFHIGLAQLADLPVPVVCAVQGAVAGGALGIMHAADIVLAAEGTKFATGFSALALSGDGGSTWYLPRLIGPKAAALMYLENRVLDAADALRLGMVSEVVAPDALADRAERLVATLAAGPTAALGTMRRLLRRSADASLVEQLDAERRALIGLARQPEAGEGIAAFVGKRAPHFDVRPSAPERT